MVRRGRTLQVRWCVAEAPITGYERQEMVRRGRTHCELWEVGDGVSRTHPTDGGVVRRGRTLQVRWCVADAPYWWGGR